MGRPDACPPTITPEPMQHALLRGDLDAVRDFQKLHRGSPVADVVLLDMYRSEREGRLVFPTIVEEENLRQEILVEARPHPEGVLVGVSSFGHPLPTPGIKAAIQVASEFLQSRGFEVLRSWC